MQSKRPKIFDYHLAKFIEFRFEPDQVLLRILNNLIDAKTQSTQGIFSYLAPLRLQAKNLN